MTSDANTMYEDKGSSLNLMQHLKQLQKNTVEYSKRSFGLLVESEEIEVETSKNISNQREQLENTLHSLDEAENNLNGSQKYLNGLKNVFGSVSQWWSNENSEIGTDKSKEQPMSKITSHMTVRTENCQPSSSTLTDKRTGLSTELSSEIGGQNKVISHLQTKADSLDSRMESQIKRMNKLLK